MPFGLFALANLVIGRKSVAIGPWEQSVMRMKNASKAARLRVRFTEFSVDSLRQLENSTPSRLQPGQLVH